MAGFTKYFGGRFKWAHLVWAFLALGLSLLPIFGGGTGHPPAILLLPLVLVLWGIGHVVLWGIAWLMVKGRSAEGTPGSWPVGLIIALIGTGLVGFHGAVQLVVTFAIGEWYPFKGALWFVGLAIALAHAAGFVGMLLRHSWARAIAAGLSIGWALLLSRQIVDHVSSGYRIEIGELVLALAGIAVLLVFGIHLWRSHRIKAFMKAG